MGKLWQMLVWHSAQARLPTNLAPGISGAAVRLRGVVEQEMSTRTTHAARPRAAAAARYRSGFLIAGWPLTAYVRVGGMDLFLRFFRRTANAAARRILVRASIVALCIRYRPKAGCCAAAPSRFIASTVRISRFFDRQTSYIDLRQVSHTHSRLFRQQQVV